MPWKRRTRSGYGKSVKKLLVRHLDIRTRILRERGRERSMNLRLYNKQVVNGQVASKSSRVKTKLSIITAKLYLGILTLTIVRVE